MDFWELMNDSQQESMLDEAAYLSDIDDFKRWFNTGCQYAMQNILHNIQELEDKE